MIFIYDASIVGCCNRREAVRRLIEPMEPKSFKLRNLRAFRGGLRKGAHLVYTDDESIKRGYVEAGVPVEAIGPNFVNTDDESIKRGYVEAGVTVEAIGPDNLN